MSPPQQPFSTPGEIFAFYTWNTLHLVFLTVKDSLGCLSRLQALISCYFYVSGMKLNKIKEKRMF